jgi:hypothetical protein
MGAIKWILRKLGGSGRKLAVRSRWLAKRLWVVMLADVLWTTRRHWVRLEPQERLRLLQLAKKSQGRPATNLTKRERREASDLLDKLGHIEYAGSLAGIVLPFRPLSRLAAKFLESRRSEAKRRLDEADADESGDARVVIPTKPGAEKGAAPPPESESAAGSKA